MISPDWINGTFEFLGAGFIYLSIRKVLKDKIVHGINWLTVAFFAAWGIWNLYYYPFLDQWWSFSGGIALVIVNIMWIVLLIHYRPRTKQRIKP